jgi:hypothetical protein
VLGGVAPSGPGSSLPSRDELTKAWGDEVLPSLRPATKAYVSSGRFVEVDGPTAVFALPDPGLVARAGSLRGEVEAALAAYFNRPVPLRFVLDGDSLTMGVVAAADDRDEEEGSEEEPGSYDWGDMADAGAALVSPEQRLLEAFPGAEEVTP